MSNIGAPLTGTTLVPVYTANNVSIRINGATIALVQHITISRAVNRRPIAQVGTSLWADIPPTTVGVTVTCTNTVAIPNGQVLALWKQGILPSGSLVNVLTMSLFQMTVVDALGNSVATVLNAGWNSDNLDITANDPLPENFNLLAQDCVLNV